MPTSSVAVKIACRVATLTLDRLSSANAIDEQMAAELRDACERVAHDDDIRVVVVTGKGEAFCRGTEAGHLPAPGARPDALHSLRVADVVAAIEVPVIAAINGDAIDQGLELALACDIRVASMSARLGALHVADGLIPWDGGTQRLPRLVGVGKALEMILTCRLVGADIALNMGLVNEVVEPGHALSRALQLASTIAGHGPIAARYLKEAVMEGQDLTLGQGLRLEADLNLLLHSTEDRAEGIRSFIEGRPPHYRGE